MLHRDTLHPNTLSSADNGLSINVKKKVFNNNEITYFSKHEFEYGAGD